MQKNLKNLGEYLVWGTIIAVSVGLAISLVAPLIQTGVGNPTLGYNQSIVLDNVNQTATTTESFCLTCPVLVSDTNYGRKYLRVQNSGDTGAIVYLYLTNTELQLNLDGSATTAATSTITDVSELIPLTPTSTMVINRDNLFTGQVWATTTDGISSKILILEQ